MPPVAYRRTWVLGEGPVLCHVIGAIISRPPFCLGHHLLSPHGVLASSLPPSCIWVYPCPTLTSPCRGRTAQVSWHQRLSTWPHPGDTSPSSDRIHHCCACLLGVAWLAVSSQGCQVLHSPKCIHSASTLHHHTHPCIQPRARMWGEGCTVAQGTAYEREERSFYIHHLHLMASACFQKLTTFSEKGSWDLNKSWDY